MKNLFSMPVIAAVAALVFGGSATAADMPVKAAPVAAPVAYSWTGLYFGFSDGFQWQHANWAFDPSVVGGAHQSFSADRSSSILGGQIGVQWQWNQIVIGAEYDHFGSPWRDESIQGVCGAGAFTCLVRMQDLDEAGGRLGWAGSGIIPFTTNWLLYATGGWARGTVQTDGVPPGSSAVGSNVNATSLRQSGWFVGAGLDTVLMRGSFVDWIAGIQYQHVDLGTAFHCNFAPCVPGPLGNVSNRDIGMTDDMFLFRTSLKFHP